MGASYIYERRVFGHTRVTKKAKKI